MSRCAELDRLIDFGDPAGSEAKLRERLEGETDFQVGLEIRALIARTMGLQGKYVDALNALKGLKYDLPPDRTNASVRVELEEGRCYNDTDCPEEAYDRFLNAYHLAEQLQEEFLAMDALHMLAIVGVPESQIKWAERALNRLDLITDLDAANWRGPILNNLGWSYFDAGETDKALDIFVSSVEFRRDGPLGPLLIAQYSVARCYRQLERYGEALPLLEKLREQNDSIGRPAPFVEEEWGECLLALGEAEKARPHFALAYAGLAADEDLAKNESERIKRLRRLSEGLT